ncbi:MAG: SDR family NAD(P)-dependent oxidoreductase [Halioglobus sp.]|nr:SDR family NAD(P)-dependent oxidoreductase [Halioglobus sp.]
MLENRTILVTGANGALGKVVCTVAEAQGARVLRLDIACTDEAQDSYAIDLTDLAATKALLDDIGPFDGVFNLAGGFAMGASAWEHSDDDWQRLFALNVTTLRNMLKAAVPLLLKQGGGSIVNVGAYGAREGQAQMSAYCASKSVVMRLTESLANELRHKGINVNAVLPTVIDTPANRAGMPDADFSEWVSTEDLANVICFLGSRAAAAVHGALLPVRGLS